MVLRMVVTFLLLWATLHLFIQTAWNASWKQRIKVGKSLLYSGVLATIVAVGLALVVQIF